MSLQFRNSNRQGAALGPETLVTLIEPRSPSAEAYRTLRTNIQFSSLDKPVSTLLFTSPRPGEDKSVAVANLAITFAQLGSRVILVDADLRRPALHTLFSVANDQGLTSALLSGTNTALVNGKAKGVSELPLVQTSVPNLRLMTSGPLPPNPAEVLGSTLLRDLIQRLRDDADYVLFDAPPLLAVTDASILATKVDATLLVLKAGKTSRDDAREAKEQLEKVHANLLGTVLNNAPRSRSNYGY
ncbi:MAG TPA: CpsD/CapB family tyrosine-protein kinase [Chloroflexia bacterium]|nr:CpsD/CapB family tyrosine-protein kinase [Chloroflexia bacterium]